MRHRVKGKKLGRDTGHRRALLRNLVTSFLEKAHRQRVQEEREEIYGNSVSSATNI